MKRGYYKTYIKILMIIIIIAVMILGAIYFVNKQYDNEKVETLKTDMLLLEAKVKILEEKVNIKEKGAKYIGTELKEKKAEEEFKNLIEKEGIKVDSKKNKYYVIDNSNLEELGLGNIKLDEGYYVVDYKTNEIFYTHGIKDEDGNVKYSLSELGKTKSEEGNRS